MAADICCAGQERLAAREKPPRFSRAMSATLALGLALMLGGTLGPMLLPPGWVIRGELESAAADLKASAPGAPDAVALRRLGRHFPRHAATIDAKAWPQVAVTLHDVPRDTCRDAAQDASRIEGLVVIELERYRGAEDCAAINDMTWRLMP
jgi:hypothetical protein